MKNLVKKPTAFTLAEVLIMFVIIGIIVSATIGITKQKLNYAKRQLYYAAFTNLKQVTGELIVDGWENAGVVKKQLPDTGLDFCTRFSGMLNTVGTVDCTITTTGTLGVFDSSKANFTTTNGMRYYNFGAAHTISPGFDCPHEEFYTVYIDIDGTRGKSTENNDIMKFIIDRNGQVLPAVDSVAANSTDYLSASVKNFPTSNPASIGWLEKGIEYRKAACTVGAVASVLYNENYCTEYPKSGTCDTLTSLQICELVVNKP